MLSLDFYHCFMHACRFNGWEFGNRGGFRPALVVVSVAKLRRTIVTACLLQATPQPQRTRPTRMQMTAPISSGTGIVEGRCRGGLIGSPSAVGVADVGQI